MSKPTKKGLVPALRFPEFRDSEAWSRKKLGEAAIFYNGRAYSQEELREQGKYRVLRVGNFFTNNSWYYSDLELEETKYCDRGDLLYAWSASFGPRIWEGDKVIYHYHIWKVVEKDGINKAFLFAVLNSQTERLKAQSSNGLGLMHITKGAIESWECGFPNKDEQEKIAGCLSSIDELIVAESQKLETLKTHKKGLMQQLFPAEGETVPKLRFSEFRGGKEWSYRVLGDFISERCELPDASVPLYSLTIENGISPKTERYERSFLVKNEEEAYKLVQPNDFAYNPMNLRFGAIGRHSGNSSVSVSKYYNIFYCDNSVDSRFCEIYFKSPKMVSHYDDVAIGSLIEKRRVHFSDFLKFNIPFPSLEEQREIAKCLSSVDDLIAAQTQELDKLKAQKKGLMQQLFSDMDEVEA